MSLSKLQRIGIIATAAAMLAIAFAAPRFAILPIVVAVLALLLLATSLSHAGQLLEPLRIFRNRPVEIRIWGDQVPPNAGASFRIESVRALGAGLHLFVRSGDGPLKHLKIAQPRDAEVTERVAEIGEAAYVQWLDQRQTRRLGHPALELIITE